ncbi:cryptochrome/photolyase family protein [Wenzhouxiangella marina]|uniref:Deoxyribodipyrimidine photolyase-related protein n=1 Tax=Wenzhouxiangella marina TaxID=1579979 RepID=A0A0K0XVF5_9GAMM|nr:cryptochrome/photolyase family protein [Wenzhouxiangella marina]AKS41650.1 Deoxyribodipyrimidine photolyase-related protein [Wenzhouxiangella marina]MBB6086590.1 deoxyribodipyrimidine photolyase-related protein [Wenzhouxiangella marina]
MAKLGLIFGDQLNLDHAVLAALDPSKDRLLMGELADEASYVDHHIQKIMLVFSAMRHFARELNEQGWRLDYHRFAAGSEIRSFTDLLRAGLEGRDIDEVVVSWPGEWRVLEQVRAWERELGVPVTVLPDTRFLCPLEDFEGWAKGRKQLRMELFYRQMRRKTGYLMDGDEPVDGQWNFDKDNRKRWPGEPAPPEPMHFQPDEVVQEVVGDLAGVIEGFGEAEGFDWPVTRAQARRALTHFIDKALPLFGDYQDAMHDEQDYLFHSRISSSLNLGLLSVGEACDAAESAWRSGSAPINAVEGFIRQIIGWREYVRGIYWMKMPDYAERNALGNDQPLPGWYWTGRTRMHCLRSTIEATRRNGYAHHIQRLMVTGNFALLLGVIPKEICDWYLAVYTDAYDWVELPNTLGMVMHADDGLLASKPYAASGKYIDRMSNYCKGCAYSVKETVGEQACPFNALYWDFLIRHRERFEANHRMRMMYRNVDRKSSEEVEAIQARARWIKGNIEAV